MKNVHIDLIVSNIKFVQNYRKLSPDFVEFLNWPQLDEVMEHFAFYGMKQSI